jgi:hypothetical protein
VPSHIEFGMARRGSHRTAVKWLSGTRVFDIGLLDKTTEVRNEERGLVIRPPANAEGGHLAGYRSAGPMDFVGASASVGVAHTTKGGATTSFALVIDKQHWFAFRVQNGSLMFVSNEAGTVGSASIAIDPVAHRYWRFRHDPSTNVVYWETSAAGGSWQVRHALTPRGALTATEVELSAGTAGGVSDPGAAVFDSFGLEAVKR